MLHLCHTALTQIIIGVSGSEVSGILETSLVIKTAYGSAEWERKWSPSFPPFDISNLSQSSGVSCHLLVSDWKALMHQLQRA